MEIDALKEVGNVGIGHAATALSKMLGKKVDINLPQTKFIPVLKFSENAGGPENIVIGLILETTGGIKGQSIFLFDEKDALRLTDLMMMQEPGTSKKFDEMNESAFSEMGNIVVGAYLSSLADMLNTTIYPGLPNLANDMVQAVLDSTLAKLSERGETLLSVKTKLIVEGDEINGIFFLIFEEESLKIVLDKLNETMGLK